MSVGRFFLFSFSQNLNRSTSAHFHITFPRFVSVANFGKLYFPLAINVLRNVNVKLKQNFAIAQNEC